LRLETMSQEEKITNIHAAGLSVNKFICSVRGLSG